MGFVKDLPRCLTNCSGLRDKGLISYSAAWATKAAFFFLKVLCPIVFISALIGILQYIKVLPFIIRIIGTVLSKVNGMGKLESFNAVSSLIWANPKTSSPTRIS